MIRPIIKDIFFLGQKSDPATKQDLSVGQDLMDTLKANQDRCVGMAANMICVKKKIIIVNAGLMNIVMYNPVILKKDTPYEACTAYLFSVCSAQNWEPPVKQRAYLSCCCQCCCRYRDLRFHRRYP